MLVDVVNRLIAMDVESIISSSHSIELLKCYSKLYMSGAQPRTCANSQRLYFAELQKTGLTKAKSYDMAQIRTCKPTFMGNLHITGYGFVHGELITDEQAIYLLSKKLLPETMFVILPEGYKQKPTIMAEAAKDEPTIIDEPKPVINKQKRTRTKKH